MKLFFLTSELNDGDAASQLALLACELPRDRFQIAVGVLNTTTEHAAEALSAAGVTVVPLPVRNVFDFSGMRRLQQSVSVVNPDAIHAFGAAAAHTARQCAARVVMTGAANPGTGVSGWLAARAVRRAERVIATGFAEGDRYHRLGVHSDRLTRIAPAVAPPGKPPDRAAFCRAVNAPEDARLIFAGGQLDAAHRVKDAVTAFDRIRYSTDLQLVLTGTGPDRPVAEELGRALAFDDYRVRFSGSRADLAAAMQLAEQVWVLREYGGELLALRAMAAGKPVVAYRSRELCEIIDDGVTGFLVPIGDRAALATKARLLLDSPEVAARMGEAGRKRAAERFSVVRLIEHHAQVYQELAGQRE